MVWGCCSSCWQLASHAFRCLKVRHDLALIKVKETFLIWAHLMDVDLIDAYVYELLNLLDVTLGVWAENEIILKIIFLDQANHIFKLVRGS